MSAMHHVKSKRVKTLVLKTATYTFAIYLVHPFAISLLRRWQVKKLLLGRVSILPTFLRNWSILWLSHYLCSA